MDQKHKNAALLAIACLLLLVAVYRFGAMAMEARSLSELNSHPAAIHPQIISHVGPQKPDKLDPFRDLDLTTEQRRKIDDILKASMKELPSPNQGGSGKPHLFRVVMPMDKIRAVLTPEQRKKFDQLHAGNQKAVMGMPGGAPGPAGPLMLGSGPPPGPGGPQMFISRQGGPDHSP